MKKKGQASIEFSLGLIIAILFLLLTCNLFVWFNRCLIRRQLAYENSRVRATRTFNLGGNPGEPNFYNPQDNRLNVFRIGGGD